MISIKHSSFLGVPAYRCLPGDFECFHHLAHAPSADLYPFQSFFSEIFSFSVFNRIFLMNQYTPMYQKGVVEIKYFSSSKNKQHLKNILDLVEFFADLDVHWQLM